jgi:hypothetical protein
LSQRAGFEPAISRFYIGEVVYRGETFRGDHEPILDLTLFAAVQAKLASQAVERITRSAANRASQPPFSAPDSSFHNAADSTPVLLPKGSLAQPTFTQGGVATSAHRY